MPKEVVAVSGKLGLLRYLVWFEDDGDIQYATFSPQTTAMEDWMKTLLSDTNSVHLYTYPNMTRGISVEGVEVIHFGPGSKHNKDLFDLNLVALNYADEMAIAFYGNVEVFPVGTKPNERQLKAQLDYYGDAPVVPHRNKRERISIYTDASQSLDGTGVGVCGWVLEPEDDGLRGADFGFHITKRYDATPLEALGVLFAIMDNSYAEHITIYSDSVAGSKMVQKILFQVSNGGIIDDAFIRGHIRRNDLAEVLSHTEVLVKWVRGHDGNKWNEAIDFLVKKIRYRASQTFEYDLEDLRVFGDGILTSWLKAKRKKTSI